MPIPVGVQLGVELTNFVGPLTKTAFRLGTLAVREAIERSGSDELTELKLAHILGRHRLDPAIATHFRSIVARSSHAPLSQFVKDLVLESGSGPTVSQALVSNNAALLSMVVQLSFLAFSHDHQSLAQAMTQAIDDMLIDGKAETSHGLNYVSLLGTVIACQQQTVAFSWEPHYAAIEHKIFDVMRTNNQTTKRRSKRRRTSGQSGSRIQQQSVADRALPFTILRGLLTSLDSIQRFPEDGLLQLSCDRGISSAVLWCYHIMGLSVLVRISDSVVHFGNGPYNITIEHCNGPDASAVLLQRAVENIPVFTLTTTDVDPYIQSDQRQATRGYLRHVLKVHGVEGEGLRVFASFIVLKCMGHIDSKCEQSSPGALGAESFDSPHLLKSDTATPSSEGVELASMNSIPRPKIIQTASFLFDLDEEQLSDADPELASTLSKRTASLWDATVSLVYALSRVKELTACALLPLSLDAFDGLTSFHGSIPDTIHSFELICKLLLGRLYSKPYVSNASLISSRGWSIFFDTIDAADPADVASGSLHIRSGVPARNGIRKARIIDGMTDFGVHSTKGILLKPYPRISFWPGVWTAKLVGTHIGYHDHDAFTVVQTYDWAHSGQKCKKWRLGFREKQEMSMKFRVYCKCSCSQLQDEVETRRVLDSLLVWPIAVKQETIPGKYIAQHPEADWNAPRIPERIFFNDETWFFYVTGSGVAVAAFSVLSIIAGYRGFKAFGASSVEFPQLYDISRSPIADVP
ncbi:hypothetical protein F53441_5017 [Fusarium austroafricanum]|uniref:Uncharacterized protein n=1 Tax=Fusarium austroafricanum TaxID=2364996 RepID=A0A8H4NY58_9HYPO|nr:hypothetical protein F53441_5017 [Fusarium austroafricanum]